MLTKHARSEQNISFDFNNENVFTASLRANYFYNQQQYNHLDIPEYEMYCYNNKNIYGLP